MKEIEQLIDRIIDRVNINLRHTRFDVGPYVRRVVPLPQFAKFYAFYGLTPLHPLRFYFRESSLAGSYFLGKCEVEYSVLYKVDVRGDELKTKGQSFTCKGMVIPLHDDEMIIIRDSFLNKTLIHSNSHDPERPEEFRIRNTVALPYVNIHGAPTEGTFLGPFATVDLTTVHNSVIGTFAYVQTGELSNEVVEPGVIRIDAGDFSFHYAHDTTILPRYIAVDPGSCPRGEFMDFVEGLQEEFEQAFATGHLTASIAVPEGASVSPYAVVQGDCQVGRNVLVAQRAYISNSRLGDGSNAQENCYIIGSVLEGLNVTAHGGKIIHCRMGRRCFTGFNSFLRGSEDAPVTVGARSIVMPHTIIDAAEEIQVPEESVIWGYITKQKDLETNSLPLAKVAELDGEIELGSMRFSGNGKVFVEGFRHRIEHILEENGAYFDGTKGTSGHAQKGLNISYNIIQPYREGNKVGLYPTIEIQP